MRGFWTVFGAVFVGCSVISLAAGPTAAGSRDYNDYRYYPPPAYYPLTPTAPPPSVYPSPLAPYFPRPVEYYAPPAIVYYPPPVVYYPAPEYIRPASCGRYRYWTGEYCSDAREQRPYVGPRW